MTTNRHNTPHRWAIGPGGPTPELLAAYGDGELDPTSTEQVEAWLADHPEAAAEVEAGARVLRLYQDTSPPEPALADWDDTLAHIHASLPAPGPAPVARWSVPRWLRLAVGLVAAAALVGGVLLARQLWPAFVPPPRVGGGTLVEWTPDPDEVFEVATAAEINIISMDARDVDAIATDAPLMGSFELAGLDDIEVLHLEPHGPDGCMPSLMDDGDVPMIVVAAAGSEEP